MNILAISREARNTSKRNVVDAARSRMRMGRDIGTALTEAARSENDAEALATADMILEAAKVENIWHGEDLNNSDGEPFEGFGSLNVPSSRLAPEYMAVTSRRARRRVKDALDRCRPQSGEHLRMVTLTMPKIEAGFEKTMAVFDDARARLRKRQWFKKTFRGGVFGEEFTLGEAGEHYHVHCHVMAWSKWVAWVALGEEWTSCLEASAVAHSVEMDFATSHGRAVVDVRLVTPSRRGGKGTMAMDDAVKEVAKYITKGSTFTELAPAQLIEVERTLRGRRMVETFGEANRRKGKTDREAGVQEVSENTNEKRTYLDNQCTVDGKAKYFKSKKERAEPLRLVGARMIRAGRRREWLETLRFKFAERREWRKAQLAERFPAAIFRTLSGEVWYGEDIALSRTLSDRVEALQRGEALSAAGFSAIQHRMASSLA